MKSALEEVVKPVLVGRSSSHFTRVARIFASELQVDCAFQPVLDLTSTDRITYGGNPALRVPTLKTDRGVWFGTLNICRELSRQSALGLRIVWPEHFEQALFANTQELILQAMATEVPLIMAKLSGSSESSTSRIAKLRTSLQDTLSWLEDSVNDVLAGLPAGRDLSYLEVTLFCLVTHLEFREVVSTAAYTKLNEFCQQFASRASVQETQFRFDT